MFKKLLLLLALVLTPAIAQATTWDATAFFDGDEYCCADCEEDTEICSTCGIYAPFGYGYFCPGIGVVTIGRRCTIEFAPGMSWLPWCSMFACALSSQPDEWGVYVDANSISDIYYVDYLDDSCTWVNIGSYSTDADISGLDPADHPSNCSWMIRVRTDAGDIVTVDDVTFGWNCS